jgi:DNA-binding NarL/FixJ family response regulator
VTYCQYPRRHRALIVEDELLIALNLEAEMNALGFNICILAPRANKACPLAMSDHPDIVLMDLYDGVREGIEAAKRLREEHGIPLVFLTSYTDSSSVERIRRLLPVAPILPKAAYTQPPCRCRSVGVGRKTLFPPRRGVRPCHTPPRRLFAKMR